MTKTPTRISSRALIAALVLLASAVAFVSHGSANSLNDEQQALLQANAARDAALQRGTVLDAQAAAMRDDASRLQAEGAAIAARIQAAEADVSAGLARIDLIEALRRRQRARLADEQEPAVKLIAALELMGRRPPALAFLQAGSVRDTVHLRAVLDTMMPVIVARTTDLRKEVARGVQLRASADLAQTALLQSRAQLVAQQNSLAANAAATRTRADTLADNAQTEQERAQGLSEKARDIGVLMTSLQAEAQIRDTLADLPGPVMRPANLANIPTNLPLPQSATPLPTLNYRLPVMGQIMTGLGEETVPGVRSRGLTIATQPNALAVAPSSGTIVFADMYRGYGKIIIIDHGHGLTTLITNLARLNVRVGDSVIQGSPLGNVGSSQPSITVELRRNGAPIDITPLIS